MTARNTDTHPLQQPLAELESELIAAYLEKSGHDLHSLLARADPEARALLIEATAHASQKLTEVEAKAHYVRNLHGQP